MADWRRKCLIAENVPKKEAFPVQEQMQVDEKQLVEHKCMSKLH